jgi:hypothetical protein
MLVSGVSRLTVMPQIGSRAVPVRRIAPMATFAVWRRAGAAGGWSLVVISMPA